MEKLSWEDIGVGITLEELTKRVEPHFQPRGQFCGFYVPEGWAQLVCALHEKLVRIDPDYRLDQAKEKFGTLRYYVTLSPRCSLPDEVDGLITQAELRSAKTCQRCGKPGSTRGKFWLVTACDACYPNDDGRAAASGT